MSRFVRPEPSARTGTIVLGAAPALTSHAPACAAPPASAAMYSTQALLGAMAARGTGMVAHADRVAATCELVGHAFALDPAQQRELHLLALLHDVGQLLVPTTVLDHRHDLQDEHWEVLHSHATRGEAILAAIPALSTIAPAVRATSEHWDGTGRPDGLRHEAIPLFSRIIAVCNAWDAITNGPDELDLATARTTLRKDAGTKLCPVCVDVLLSQFPLPQAFVAPDARLLAHREFSASSESRFGLRGVRNAGCSPAAAVENGLS
jgi:response regulator RpfG family c-di-GMP phosphodiesterase